MQIGRWAEESAEGKKIQSEKDHARTEERPQP
jgi:hypothetical protein